jgi:S1-C subfamily serine protease
VILAIDGVEIHDRGELYKRIWSRAPGDDIQLQVYNDKDVRDVKIKAGDAEEFFS